MSRSSTSDPKLVPRMLLVEPFDITLYATDDALRGLQSRFAMWARGFHDPARFVTWQIPGDLTPRLDYITREAATTPDPRRRSLLMEYRRFYEQLGREGNYQRTLCGLCHWVEPTVSEVALTGAAAGALGTGVVPGNWPPLPGFERGDYRLSPPTADFRGWHLAPKGRPGGRPYWCFLVSYSFSPTVWTFAKPLPTILSLPYTLALAVDIPRTYERNDGIARVEGVITAYQAHLASGGTDSRSVQKLRDCHLALDELNGGDALHEVQIVIGVAAHDRVTLRKQVDDVLNTARPYFGLRPEIGRAQARAASFFTARLSKSIRVPQRTWQLTSRELALTFATVGQRKFTGMRGVMRGEATGDSRYPFFHDSWGEGKKATHECWVGMSGSGKTFALNVYLTRGEVESGVPYDVLEPMGHGEHLAHTMGLPWYVLSARHTPLNPLDPMFDRPKEQVLHVLRLYATLLQRTLGGTQQGNQQQYLLGRAIDLAYQGAGGFDHVRTHPEATPLTRNVCEILYGLGERDSTREIARGLSEELAGLCTGVGPYSDFIDQRTNIDLGILRNPVSRVFSFHQMEGDPLLLAIAYTQVLTAIRRDALADDTPRVIAVDEVYRMLRHPSLIDFLVEAAKTFRTRRKKLIVIDQQMSVFLEGKARLIYENCPVRVIFNQANGMGVFYEDRAFSHMNEFHKKLIRDLSRGHFLLDITDGAIAYLHMRPSRAELARFGAS